MSRATRREFLKSTVTAVSAASIGGVFTEYLAASPANRPHAATSTTLSSAHLPIKKGVLLDMLPEKLTYADRFKMARDVGFEVVQANTEPDARKAEEIKKAADAANTRIDSVMNMDHWTYPLSSTDPAAVHKSLARVRP